MTVARCGGKARDGQDAFDPGLPPSLPYKEPLPLWARLVRLGRLEDS
jgi:hypothetical protein